MKRIQIILAGISLLIIIAGCSAPTPEASDMGVEKTFIIGPERVDCVGVGPQKCYKVKDGHDGEWKYFYNEIVGFEYEPGYQYELLVREETVANPPADGASLRWILIEILSKEAANNTGE